MNGARSFELDSSLLTGVPEIDSEHLILVNALNEVAATAHASAAHPLMDRITRDLLAYVLYHFAREERLIRQSGYALAEPTEADLHIQQHRAFADRVMALRASANETMSAPPAELARFLRDWLLQHIGTTDQRLGSFLRSRA